MQITCTTEGNQNKTCLTYPSDFSAHQKTKINYGPWQQQQGWPIDYYMYKDVLKEFFTVHLFDTKMF